MKKFLFPLLFILPLFVNGQNIGITDYDDGGGKLYWAGTIIFSTINSATTYLNIRKLHKNDPYRSNAIFGALSGGAQTAVGFVGLYGKNADDIIEVPAGINIGLGLTTLTTSIIRLATKNPPKENGLSMNMIYLPGKITGEPVLGLNLKVQFK